MTRQPWSSRFLALEVLASGFFRLAVRPHPTILWPQMGDLSSFSLFLPEVDALGFFFVLHPVTNS